jgi:hypothetical protein
VDHTSYTHARPSSCIINSPSRVPGRAFITLVTPSEGPSSVWVTDDNVAAAAGVLDLYKVPVRTPTRTFLGAS